MLNRLGSVSTGQPCTSFKQISTPKGFVLLEILPRKNYYVRKEHFSTLPVDRKTDQVLPVYIRSNECRGKNVASVQLAPSLSSGIGSS